MTSREKFVRLLRDDILKFDLAELDFGIYRILNYRRAEIERFLNEDLPNLISHAIGVHGSTRLDEVKRQLEELRQGLNQAAQSFGLTAFQDGVLDERLARLPNGQKYLEFVEELRELEAKSGFSESEEENLYKHLYDFFSRYYRDGDFVTQMRRSRNATYMAPYHGEDIHFFWKSYGSHYVKTAEELQTYSFIPNGWRVQFILVSADVEKDNNKGSDRFFIPNVDQIILDSNQKIITIPFEFRPLSVVESNEYPGKGDNVQDQIVTISLAALMPKLPDGIQRDEVARHLKRYVRKNRSDYFVHPKLGEFLREELDYYLKTFFLQLDAFTSPEAIRERFIKFQALQDIGIAIIDLLDQIESFQARLFEKRRFALKTSYLIPLRFVPHRLWNVILQNDMQIAAWRELFKLESDITEYTLRTHPTLVLNTGYFDSSFTIEALSEFDDLDKALDGILISGENYGALRLLEPLLREQVDLIYIDPPYNTGNDGFLYKDEFSRHSTWMTMMAERLGLARRFLRITGSIFVSIDDNEHANLRKLMDTIFGSHNFINNIIWQKVFAPKNTAKHFSEDHDYILVYSPNAETWHPNLLPRTEEADARYKNPDNDPRGNWASDNLLARNYYGEGSYEVTSPNGKKYRPPVGTYWRVSYETFQELNADNRIWWGESGGNMPRQKRFLSEVKDGIVPQTLWKHTDAGNTQEAKKELIAVVDFDNSEAVLNTVKPTRLIQRVMQLNTDSEKPAWVMDFFAGSGTTGHAVIKANRQDGGQRKFILVEMGDYFEKITLQRVIRTMYTPDWKAVTPINEPVWEGLSDETILPDWVHRSPSLVKIIHTESFEDSLNALELPAERAMRLTGQQRFFFNDELHYIFGALEDESLVMLNTEALEHPFDYKLRVLTPAGVHTLDVDLVETANLLLGLRVRQMHELYDNNRRYVIIEARKGTDEVLVVWRNVAELDPARERDFIREHFNLENYNIVYTNADSAIAKGEQVLDKAFRTRMLEPDQGLL
jgi:adenine-specific DNA-methyltransferase